MYVELFCCVYFSNGSVYTYNKIQRLGKSVFYIELKIFIYIMK